MPDVKFRYIFYFPDRSAPSTSQSSNLRERGREEGKTKKKPESQKKNEREREREKGRNETVIKMKKRLCKKRTLSSALAAHPFHSFYNYVQLLPAPLKTVLEGLKRSTDLPRHN